MAFDRPKTRPIELGVTPLIDIVFLLLIFFMLTSHFLVDEGLEVRLPQSKTAEIHEQKGITIFLSKDGGVFLESEAVLMSDLETLLTEIFSGGTDRPVTLKADREVALERVVTVMDAARIAGAKSVVLATELETEK